MTDSLGATLATIVSKEEKIVVTPEFLDHYHSFIMAKTEKWNKMSSAIGNTGLVAQNAYYTWDGVRLMARGNHLQRNELEKIYNLPYKDITLSSISE